MEENYFPQGRKEEPLEELKQSCTEAPVFFMDNMNINENVPDTSAPRKITFSEWSLTISVDSSRNLVIDGLNQQTGVVSRTTLPHSPSSPQPIDIINTITAVHALASNNGTTKKRKRSEDVENNEIIQNLTSKKTKTEERQLILHPSTSSIFFCSSTLSSTVGLLSLPSECLLHIFSFVPIFEVSRLALVCSSFKLLSGEASLWRSLWKNYFGGHRNKPQQMKRRGKMPLNRRIRGVLSDRLDAGSSTEENRAEQDEQDEDELRSSSRDMVQDGDDDYDDSDNDDFKDFWKRECVAAMRTIDKFQSRYEKKLLFWAAQHGHLGFIRRVVSSPLTISQSVLSNEQRKVDINIQRNGAAALHLSAWNGNEGVVKFLLKMGADVNAATLEDGRTALFMAAGNGHKKVVELLLRYGAGVDSRTRSGATALFIAAQDGRKEIVDILLKNKSDVNIAMNDGRTALYMAVWKGHKDIIRVLISHKADVNVKTRGTRKITPLHFACQEGHVGVVKLLLQHGADVYARTDRGQTALEIARAEKHDMIVKMLAERMEEIGEGYFEKH